MMRSFIPTRSTTTNQPTHREAQKHEVQMTDSLADIMSDETAPEPSPPNDANGTDNDKVNVVEATTPAEPKPFSWL
jgi:hypothetical protein